MPEKKASLDEEKITAASYIISFYQEVGSLTHNSIVYINFLYELNKKYGEGKGDLKLEEQERSVLMQNAQTVRYDIIKSWIMYKSITESTQKPIDTDLEKMYGHLKTVFIFDRNELEEYLIKFNRVLIEKVMRNLLETSTDILQGIYAT